MIIEKITSEEIVFKNGTTLTALPCDPDTTVGDTVNWFLDEWGLYPLSEKIFGTIKPSIMHGKRLMGVSTPRGRRGKFSDTYHTWKDLGDKSGWSFHVVTIEQAMREGLVLKDHLGQPISFEDFRAQEIRDIGLEMWLQEYMCVFQDAVAAFLAWESIQNCGVADQPLIKTPEQLRQVTAQGRELFGGIDIGRRHDLTVFWLVSVGQDGSYRTECVLFLARTPFRTQADTIATYLKSGCLSRVCVDNTGVGMQLAEEFQTDFAGLVEPVTFTNQKKLSMGERLRVQMEGGNFTYPADDDIAEDFASIERIVTDQGNVRLAADRSGATHGDFFCGAILALEAATGYGPNEVAMAAA